MRHLMIAALMLSACTTTWYPRRGQSEERFYEDSSTCQARAGTATQGAANKDGWDGAVGAMRFRSVYEACMRGYGWTTEKP